MNIKLLYSHGELSTTWKSSKGENCWIGHSARPINTDSLREVDYNLIPKIRRVFNALNIATRQQLINTRRGIK